MCLPFSQISRSCFQRIDTAQARYRPCDDAGATHRHSAHSYSRTIVPAVGARCNPFDRSEEFGKIVGTLIANGIADLGDGHACCAQETFSLLQANLGKVLDESTTHLLFEDATEIGGGQGNLLCHLFQCETLHIVRRDISPGVFEYMRVQAFLDRLVITGSCWLLPILFRV